MPSTASRGISSRQVVPPMLGRSDMLLPAVARRSCASWQGHSPAREFHDNVADACIPDTDRMLAATSPRTRLTPGQCRPPSIALSTSCNRAEQAGSPGASFPPSGNNWRALLSQSARGAFPGASTVHSRTSSQPSLYRAGQVRIEVNRFLIFCDSKVQLPFVFL